MPRPIHAIAALSLAALAGALVAGPLNPPAGPVASTYKTLAEVEPRIPITQATTPGDADSIYRITQPGSYYLTGNISGIASKHGIEIAAGNVTLDLMGFQLVGAPGSLHGVALTVPNLQNITVRAGAISDWSGAGIDIGSAPSRSSAVHDVRVSRCGIGISAGLHSVITRCQTYSTVNQGFVIGNGSTAASCTAGESGSIGFDLANSCSLTDCNSFDNGGSGFDGASGNTLSNCIASANFSAGFNFPGNSNVFSGCSASGNNGLGFTATNATFTGCSSTDNSNSGFSIGAGSTIQGCSARANARDGILAGSHCLVLGNSCSLNGAGSVGVANLRVTGGDTRIEGNNCANADAGIMVQGQGNIIVRNTCASHFSNWSFTINNFHGPIIDRTSTSTPAVNSNSAASTLGSTDPNANFTY